MDTASAVVVVVSCAYWALGLYPLGSNMGKGGTRARRYFCVEAKMGLFSILTFFARQITPRCYTPMLRG